MSLSHYSQLKEAQEQHVSKRKANEVDTQDINMQLAAEKKMREVAAKEADQTREAVEVEFTTNHDFMTEAQKTEVSMLAPHRVKPYHFKGKTDA